MFCKTCIARGNQNGRVVSERQTPEIQVNSFLKQSIKKQEIKVGNRCVLHLNWCNIIMCLRPCSVYSMVGESSDKPKLFPTRKKSLHSSIFLFFSPTFQKNLEIFLSNR